jgi:zinc D-Ala-D-Ala dipeptidase
LSSGPETASIGAHATRAAGAIARYALLLVLAGCAVTALDRPQLSAAKDAHSAGLVDLRAFVPDIDLDMRYAGRDNFVGRSIDGYEAPVCLLLRPAATALRRVEQSLRRQRLRLRIFDCYRPARAVREFVRWAQDVADQRTRAEYYPTLDKSQLLGDYIAPLSGHSRGATLDLTLLACDAAGASCRPLDMGTPFDFFDPGSNTASPAIDASQRANRQRLVSAMAAEGFENYAMEWWHYTLRPEPSPTQYFDVPVSAAQR